jgi:hypothetical protein
MMDDVEKFWRGVGYLLLASTASAVPVIILVSGIGEYLW